MRRFCRCFVVLIAGAAIPLAWAQPAGEIEKKEPHSGKGATARFGLMAKLRQLDLTEQQRAQVRAIFEETHPAMRPLMQQAMQERRMLRRLVNMSPVNEPAIRAQAAKVAQVRTEIEVKRAYTYARVRKLLTPEQTARLRELEAQFDRRMERMMKRAGRRFEEE
jgi:Spy/CpxP family protein refolding chaperone